MVEGSGAFVLQGQNQVDQLVGNLRNGSLATAESERADCLVRALVYRVRWSADGWATGLFARWRRCDVGVCRSESRASPTPPRESDNSMGNINPAFEQYLDTNDMGIAILNENLMTIETGALVNAVTADIYLETVGDNDLID